MPLLLALGSGQWSIHRMSETVHIDRTGRIVLPKRLRERFRLQGGDALTLEVKGDAIQLRPKKAKARLELTNGVLVLVSTTPLPEGRDLVSESRNERLDELGRTAMAQQ